MRCGWLVDIRIERGAGALIYVFMTTPLYLASEKSQCVVQHGLGALLVSSVSTFQPTLLVGSASASQITTSIAPAGLEVGHQLSVVPASPAFIVER